MKRFTSIFLALIMLFTLAPMHIFAAETGETAFSDMKATDYYAQAATALAQLNIISGYPDGTYGAEKFVTRAEMAAVVCRMLGKEEEAIKAAGKTAFSDVDATHWASGYINIASQLGIINGDGDGKFRPDDEVKYEEAIKMLVCAPGYAEGLAIDPDDWSKAYLEAADKKGIMADAKGKKGEATTRADIAVMSYNGLATEAEDSKIPATPVASIKGGEYKTTQKVKLTTVTKDADIYYTTDGTTPTVNSTKYTKEISISKTATLKAVAVKNGVVSKNVMSEDYTVKKSSGGGGGGGSSRATTYTLSFAVVENGSVNTDAAGNYSKNSTINLTATPNENYVFVKWESDNGGSFADANSASTTFTMPSANVIITAVFSEADTVPDEIAALFGVDPDDYDTDNDGLSNYIEIYVTGTDPTMADTDGNGISDADEDFDEDGLANKEELNLGTNPAKKDTDNDGINDYDELNVYHTDPSNWDTDGDTLSDGDEILLGLNPLEQKSDGVTLDAERSFTQDLNEENISEALLSADNAAIPSLTLTSCGNINNDVIIETTSSNDFSDSRAIVGEAIDISGENISEGTISFTLQDDDASPISLFSTGESYNTNLICKYNADGSTDYLDTDYDADTKTLSAEIDSEGTYFVMDVKSLFAELGLSMPTVADPILLTDPEPVALMSIDGTEEENQNRNNNDNIADEDLALSSVDVVTADINVVAASADADKVTSIAAAGAMAQADIVFIIDTTGSMSDEIRNVKNNVNAFIDVLKAKGVSAALALIDYQDLEADGYDSTKIHKNGSSNWFYDMDAYKSAISALDLGYGGDAPECAVDALETARLLDMRASAGKIFVLVTDASYKVDNRYGIPSMAAEIELLKNAGVSCSVISPNSQKSTYYNLYNDTNGIWANIYGNFNTELTTLADKIGEEIVGDGYWIYLDGPVPVPVRLDAMPEEGSDVDTDKDGIPDIDELKSATPTGELDLDELLTIVSGGVITGTDYGIVKMYEYKSSPVESDTDFDGIADDEDMSPRDNHFTGRMNRFDKHGAPEYDLNKGKISFNVDYRWFFEDNTKYNANISVLSSLYASDIYENEPDLANDSDVQVYVDGLLTDVHKPEALLMTFGLHDSCVKKVGYDADNDRTEIALGHRCVTYNGQKKEIILISVRGTNGTFSEWSSNMDVGADTTDYYRLTGNHSEWTTKENHKGFDVTANRVKMAVAQYMEDNSANFATGAQKVYWITGHSRGAGIANILGAYYEQEGKETFTYTFASPTTTTADITCKSIFNIINKDDLIPTMPLTAWMFKRYGTDKSVSVSAHSGSKTFWGAGGSYTGGVFNEMLDMNYNNNEKVDWLLNAFNDVANRRDELYECNFTKGELELSGLNHTSEADAKKAVAEYKEAKSKELQQLGYFDAVEGVNLLGQSVWRIGCYQTPGYFMQALAELAADMKFHEVAGKYEKARNRFVITYLSGMEHPHWTETYYLIAKGKFSNAW